MMEIQKGTGPTASQGQGFVLPETTVLAAIGCFDLLTSVYFIATHQAYEANPLFALMLGYFGPWGFVAMKALLLGGPLTIAEMARRRSPVFVRNALRVAIVLYVAALALAYVNGRQAPRARAHGAEAGTDAQAIAAVRPEPVSR